jgi:hypothetical protein
LGMMMMMVIPHPYRERSTTTSNTGTRGWNFNLVFPDVKQHLRLFGETRDFGDGFVTVLPCVLLPFIIVRSRGSIVISLVRRRKTSIISRVMCCLVS